MPMPWMIGYSDPCADSFALGEVGCVLLSALRDWARDSPATAALGISRSNIRFTVNVIPGPHRAADDFLRTPALSSLSPCTKRSARLTAHHLDQDLERRPETVVWTKTADEILERLAGYLK
ncbi:hypothetical protein QIS99_28640 [Streptomyces sp. B-S-A8]|uniref:Uncharacterized protein n=1 Tax=Streptomyces solicavernae TaxID=3043614 RepID=A0ABT6S2A1_9ACTN|nr:hypothetical protein [Streptomyces sp. B-S-A8]MDI3390128.1 hypothetical protein [Streptomyces sp. B-S-A8]